MIKQVIIKTSTIVRNVFFATALITILGTVVLGILMTNTEMKSLAIQAFKMGTVGFIFEVIRYFTAKYYDDKPNLRGITMNK